MQLELEPNPCPFSDSNMVSYSVNSPTCSPCNGYGLQLHRWNPDAIVFNSWQQYGTPSYWVQHFFKESSGATYHPTKIQANASNSLVASAITWQSLEDSSNYLRIKVDLIFAYSLCKIPVNISRFFISFFYFKF